MSAVAVWSPREFATSGESATLATTAVQNLAGFVAAGRMDDEIADAAAWAAQVHALGKLRKDAHELNVQTCRLECIIARRAAQIGRLDLYEDRPSYLAAAKSMGKVDDEEFDRFLARIDQDGTFPNLWGAHRYQENKARRIHTIARGGVPDFEPYEWPERGDAEEARRVYDALADRRDTRLYRDTDADDARTAAQDLLGALTAYGEPFTTNEAAEKLATILDVDAEDAVTRTGLQVMVREAIAVENRANQTVELPDGTTVKIPDVVTIQDSTVNNVSGWVRVPWPGAGLAQLGLMVAYRRQQVG